MKGSRLILINVLVLLALVVVGGVVAYYYTQGNNYVNTQDAAISAPTVPVLAMAGGVVETLHLEVGQAIRKGEVIGTERVAVTSTTSSTTKASGAHHAATVTTPTSTLVNIKAPVTGQVAQVQATVGETVGVGSPLFTAVQLGKAYVTANILETEISKVHRNQTVSITVDAQPGVTFQGKVMAIDPATQSYFSLIPTQATAGTYTKVVQRVPVVISLQSQGYQLLPGESCEVQIHLNGNS